MPRDLSLLYKEAEEDEIVDIGEGFSFLARLFKIYCPFGLVTLSSSFSMTASDENFIEYTLFFSLLLKSLISSKHYSSSGLCSGLG